MNLISNLKISVSRCKKHRPDVNKQCSYFDIAPKKYFYCDKTDCVLIPKLPMLVFSVRYETLTAIGVKNTSTLWNFYCSPINVFVLCLFVYEYITILGFTDKNSFPESLPFFIFLFYITSFCRGRRNLMYRNVMKGSEILREMNLFQKIRPFEHKVKMVNIITVVETRNPL